MGYDVHINGQLTLPADKVEDAARTLIAKAVELGKWDSDNLKEFHEEFGTTDAQETLKNAVNDRLSEGCFYFYPVCPDGSMVIEGYEDYVRREEEDEWIFKALAPFIDDGELELQGEDGAQWLYRIKDGEFRTVNATTVYGIDALAPGVLEEIIKLLYSDGKPLCIEGSDAIGTLDAIENLIREAGFGPQAGKNELERLADV